MARDTQARAATRRGGDRGAFRLAAGGGGRGLGDLVPQKHAEFDGRPVRDYVPLFVERHAPTELAKHH